MSTIKYDSLDKELFFEAAKQLSYLHKNSFVLVKLEFFDGEPRYTSKVIPHFDGAGAVNMARNLHAPLVDRRKFPVVIVCNGVILGFIP